MSNTDYLNIALQFIGGLGLFLYGMHVMAAGLQKSAGSKMKKLLEVLTKNKLMSVFVGAGVTAIIQSSSATTVMVVGFVNAGLLNLNQSVGIIMGANIGTTITSWLVASVDWIKLINPFFMLTIITGIAVIILYLVKNKKVRANICIFIIIVISFRLFIRYVIPNSGFASFLGSVNWVELLNPVALAPFAILSGAVMVLFIENAKTKQIGEIIIGFGLLFLGMSTMSVAVNPLKELAFFKDLFINLGSNPFYGVMTGMLVTAVLQSSSASVGILQALAATGLVPWNAAVYIIMGQNIGTCITAILSSIGTSKTAKSAAYIHLIFNMIGSVYFSIFAAIYFTFINASFGNTQIGLIGISIVHTSFNIANTIVLYPFSNQIIKMAEKLASFGKSQIDEAEIVHLDDRILSTPSFAIENAVKEIVRLGEMALTNLQLSTQTIFDQDEDNIETVIKREKTINSLTKSITEYLVKICNADINKEENEFVTKLFHVVNDIERVGDHCENIVELCQYSITEDVVLSELAYGELKIIIDETIICYQSSILYIEKQTVELHDLVSKSETTIDELEKKFRDGHISRLANNDCNAAGGVFFLDTLTNLERVSDHSFNIVEQVYAIN